MLARAGGADPPDVCADGAPGTLRGGNRAAVSDDAGGAADATATLIAAGHQRIVLAGATAGVGGATAERRRGYEAAMAEAGLEPRYVDRPTQEPSAVAAAVGLELRRGRRFSAVVAASDAIAIAILGELGARGVPVPAAISIIGFDDIDFASAAVVPLSSVRQPSQLMGETALRILLSEIADPDSDAQQVVFEPELVVRASTSPAA